ncbi:hypothetical protein HU200_046382 [Digitaria exilis]|uniref:F-box domain-containing protein n=1 Tax=Digitaria exilis TaxID=1010633 RepID=A0A835AYH9_9POAL|nr:hypothetical protein HU200_046382 [Digitaria exilis]
MDAHKNIVVAAGLPDDPLVEILSRATVKDLHRFKCVSKGWRGLIANPLHGKKLPQTLQGFFSSYPGESFNHDGRSFINLFGGTPPPFDPSLPFLKNLPGIRKIWLLGSYGGLLLFSLRRLGYIVFNPATEQWAAVPSEHTPADKDCRFRHAFLVFHPAVSSHFQLVIFCEGQRRMCTVHSYSSETGVWRHSQIDWAEDVRRLGQMNRWVPQITGNDSHATIFNDMLYLNLSDDQIAVVDVEGKVQRIIPGPPSVGRENAQHHSLFIGQSQGRLHYINEERRACDIPSELSSRVYTRDFDDDCDLLSVWVLEDYDTHKWALKHSVSQAHLFGSNSYKTSFEYTVAAIHPDSPLLFIFLSWNRQLISYSLDSKDVRAVCATQGPIWCTPYVSCFLDFLSVAEHEEYQGRRRGR